ncbi:MAG: putative tail protein [Prokaryotic dsDNA virus sp.]|nr:MAG: putative tail protein [Prokaryotic dsDNA virus sp.]|tara:strand:- start:8477 stop:8908 length:432 start_codon:yes stop_codon:yes gene_type:complete
MASTVFNGTNLLVKIADDGVSPATIGHSTSCSISFTNDMAAATTKDSSGFSEVIPAVRSAEISFDGLVDYTDGAGGMTGGGEIAHKLLTRQKCDFSFGTAATGDTVYTGEGYISAAEISGAMEEAVTYSGTITVTGAITESVN